MLGVWRMRTKSSGWLLAVSMTLIMGMVSPSFAQESASSGGQGSAPVVTSPGGNAPTVVTGTGQEISPTGQYQEGLAVGGWMLFPEIFVGAVYNTNPDQLADGGNKGTSLRVSPRLVGTYDYGINRGSVYGVMDGQFFNSNTIAATAGVSNSYQPQEDWALNSYFNYTRETSIFNSALNFNNNAIGPPGTPPNGIPFILNPFGTIPTVNPIAYNQFTGGAAVTKKLNDQLSASLGATAFYILYDQQSAFIPPPFQTSNNGASIWVQGRVSYHFLPGPGFYVFGEGDGIFQRFNNSVFDTNGYRVIGGFGSDNPESLYTGEIYGGYQAQHQLANDNVFGTPSIPLTSPNGIPTDINSGVFGGRLSYYPTRYWTFIASVDTTLGITTTLQPGIPAGTPSRVTTAMLQTNYAIAHDWWVGARAGFTQGFFFGVAPQSIGWLAGASFNYAIWRNLLLTLDYQFTTEHADGSVASFTQNTYTAGLTYKY
jgi:hypothetical protein